MSRRQLRAAPSQDTRHRPIMDAARERETEAAVLEWKI